MQIRNRSDRRRRGAAVITVLIAVGTLGTLSMAILGRVSSSFRLNQSIKNQVGARYLAEAGLAIAVDDLRQGGSGSLGEDRDRVDYGGGDFWVETVDLGGGLTSVIATGVRGRTVSRVELVLADTNDAFYTWAAFGDLGLTMDSNAHVDSYNSSDAAYNPVNGSGNDFFDLANGTVGSNAGIALDSNSLVFGDAVPGPDDSVLTGVNAEVTGTTTPNTGVVELPEIEMPVIASTGDWSPSGVVTLASGDHGFDTFRLAGGATLTIRGPARILCDNMLIRSNAEIIVDSTNGAVEFYVRDDFVMNSNTRISADGDVPGDVAIFLETNNIVDPDVVVDLDEVDFDSNAKLYATVYAPNAHVEINSNFELFGALVAKSVHLDSNSYLHFDEALMEIDEDEAAIDYSLVAWRELPVSTSEIEW
ncbi:MAG: hypothetical protein ACI8QZ_000688 [Chlamydiales bacterium]|jgi:hypothetical protein